MTRSARRRWLRYLRCVAFSGLMIALTDAGREGIVRR
jgi:hypothetical protein